MAKALQSGDIYIVKGQIGKKPRGVIGVAKRCDYGYPQVIVTKPLIDEELFPTTYWLTCPELVSNISKLESEGWIGKLTSRMGENQALRKAHQEYAGYRYSLLEDSDIQYLQESSPRKLRKLKEDGIGGVRTYSGVKCLHAHLAHGLAGRENVVAEMLFSLEPELKLPEDRCKKLCDKWSKGCLYGAVDIGTNSTRLFIANVYDKDNIEQKLYRADITRLGEDLKFNGLIGEPAILRTEKILSVYNQELKDIKTIAVGTSAIRDAQNREYVKERLSKVLGVPIQVITGEKEAELTYLGASRGFDESINQDGNVLVVDIGGGSTELIYRVSKEVNCYSIDIGCVRLTEEFITTDPPIKKELENASKHIKNELTIISMDTIGAIVGVGGTVTTLAAIDSSMERYDPNKIHGYVLRRERISDIYSELTSKTILQRSKIPGLQQGREDIIVIGTLILLSILEVMGIDRIIVSESDILEGMIYLNIS